MIRYYLVSFDLERVGEAESLGGALNALHECDATQGRAVGIHVTETVELTRRKRFIPTRTSEDDWYVLDLTNNSIVPGTVAGFREGIGDSKPNVEVACDYLNANEPKTRENLILAIHAPHAKRIAQDEADARAKCKPSTGDTVL